MSTNGTNTTNPTPTPVPLPAGDIAWVMASTALVFLMIPGVGYFYSGMARSKNALSLIMLSVLSAAVVSFQWWLIGYSLTFGTATSKYIGSGENAFFMGVDMTPFSSSVPIPKIAYALYQCMFAAITPALALGSAAERGRILPKIIFIFVWTTLVYDFIACWSWNPNGWLGVLGALDFAGGTPVHIASGTAALAYAIILGKRHGHGANARAAMACAVTNLSAAVAIGIIGAFFCNIAVHLKHIFDFDDALDVFAVHGVGGVVGNILTGIFAQKSIAALDGVTVIAGGWLDGNFIQLGYQLADSAAGMAYSFIMTYIILFIMDKIPGLSLRADPESEAIGIDESELGELAYYHIDKIIAVNKLTGETKTVKEETVLQNNDVNVSIV
ncbi:7398_t:CDS:2 [Gigaspora margarita]|uniref:7398_t:CDS:1 n=1 Tax=Gigaspora margarita TaxID=4874 RepID=A0ABN7UNS1_GIGMA|nr:7398_t:CDS:2 [Gigaspora margarita]